jgi:argininosuccinate lyase
MSINCSAKSTFKPLQIMQSTSGFIDEQRNADMLDALADIAHEQEQAMREQWDEPTEDQHERKD